MTTINDIQFILPCAGHSTRNYPQSKGLAHKAFLPFGSYRLIDHILKDIIAIGGKHITIVCSDEEAIHAFKTAFGDDSAIQDKLRGKGRDNIADVLEQVAIPEDVEIRYVVQEEALGTAHVLAIAYPGAEDKHGIMIFPDDIFISKDENNPHLKKVVNQFLENDKQSLITGVRRDDVSNNSILQDGRLVEKPSNPTTDIGGFSPMIFPVAMMKHIHDAMKTFTVSGQEWFYTDAVNDFMDTDENSKEYAITMPLKDDCDVYMDVGARPLYEKALLVSMFTLSKEKEDHMKEVEKLLK